MVVSSTEVPRDDARAAARPTLGDSDELMIWPGRIAFTADQDFLREVLRERLWDDKVKVAQSWHVSRLDAQFAEVGATAHGIGRDRVYELLGCMSSTGERFGLAIAAGNEVALWNRHRSDVGSERDRLAQLEMSLRAMAELFGYYLLGTGHMLAAIVMRALSLEEELRPRLLDTLGASCVVDSRNLSDWPSLNIDNCRRLRRVARDSKTDTLKVIVEPITNIVQSSSWAMLDAIRGEDYHRRRPQTALVDGVPPGSAWTTGPDGSMSLALGSTRPRLHDDRAVQTTNVMFDVERVLLKELAVLRSHLGKALVEIKAVKRAQLTTSLND